MIVTNKYLDINIRNLHFSESEAKSKILNIDNQIAVYIRGEIVPRRYTNRVTYDYSNCDENGDLLIGDASYEGKEIMVGIDDYDNTACPIIISTPIVIDACFKSKGPNYNPYN